MLARLLATSALVIAMPAVAQTANPFAKPSTLPYQAPDFRQIKDGDYLPAFEQGMKQQRAEIAAITANRAAPTFDNTIGAMEKSGRMLDRVSSVFFALSQANTNDTLQAVETEITPKLTAHGDAIALDPKLFARIKTLYDKRATLKLSVEQAQLLKVTYQRFVDAGAQLSAADQVKLRALNTQISTLQTAFQQKLLAGTKAGALVVDDVKKLDGLGADGIAAAAKAAADRGLAGKWLLPLQNTTQQPALASLTDRATRQALFEKSWTRSEQGDANDTRATIASLAQFRAQKAKLLGYPTYADYSLTDQMAETSTAAKAFLTQFAPALAAKQREEAAEIQARIKATGGTFELKPWDWDFYSEQVRKAKYDLDGDALKPYFEINKVLTDGVFYAATELYGITFKERKDLPVYDADMRVFEVSEANGTSIGVMYFDYWKRDNKSGGAWMSNFVGQSKLLGTKPVIYNVANFTKPAAGSPALISFDDVTTMFHEFGHALHGLFADQVYPTLSGSNTARDFVEFPSQFNEHWALDPKVLSHYAVNYKTGAAMPQALVDKIKSTRSFNQGYSTGEAQEAAALDLAWHSLPADAPKQDVDAFEAKTLAGMGLQTQYVPPRYRTSYFSHIWGGGYAAGYYAYAWTQMLDHDAFAWFTAHGGLTRANGQRFRDLILSRGHTLDYGPMFKAFYGKDPDVGPMAEYLGLTGK
ncbi:M3 family metallopeptidase [Sphingomonas hylomeconis]|uniref:M3 family metallopeptidase n=1 Tax=Sphingomonas hylomeconis TaxID=1395958 RepID=A0ABV7SRY1_9SPHN|nr:M3 family metallopeptidase [Sphingomonas hylomeconis]